MMIIGRRDNVYYQVNGVGDEARRLHGHVSAFVRGQE